MIHQPLGGAQGQAADIEIQAKEILFVKSLRKCILFWFRRNRVHEIVSCWNVGQSTDGFPGGAAVQIRRGVSERQVVLLAQSFCMICCGASERCRFQPPVPVRMICTRDVPFLCFHLEHS